MIPFNFTVFILLLIGCSPVKAKCRAFIKDGQIQYKCPVTTARGESEK